MLRAYRDKKRQNPPDKKRRMGIILISIFTYLLFLVTPHGKGNNMSTHFEHVESMFNTIIHMNFNRSFLKIPRVIK